MVCLDWLLSYVPIYVPIVMCNMRLFYKNCNDYNDVYMLISSELQVSITSPSFVALNLLLSEIVNYIA